MAMIRLDNRIESENLPLKMLLQVHDELILEVPEGKAEEMAALVKREWSKSPDFPFHYRQRLDGVKNWAEAH